MPQTLAPDVKSAPKSGEKLEEVQSRPRLLRTISSNAKSLIGVQHSKSIVLKSHGRPPWYGEDGKHISDAFVIGVAGGSASGKTHVARQIVKSLGSVPMVVIMSQDSFYKEHTPDELKLAFANEYDFDHPDAIDMDLFSDCLADLKHGRQTNIPVYSFTAHQREKEKKYLYGASIIIAEGIMALHDPKLRDLYDLRIFVNCDSDLMLARRITRDVKERGRSVEGVLEQYLRFVKPAFDSFVLPTSRYADIIVPGSNNSVAIDLITTHVRKKLEERHNLFRGNLIYSPITPVSDRFSFDIVKHGHSILGIHILRNTPQLRSIYTILRDKTTSKADFIFFVDRLSTLLIENALQFLPFVPKTVITPTGAPCEGKTLGTSHLCGVTIQRSGGPLESGLQRVIKDITIGSMLIQSDSKTSEPILLHLMLPTCIKERHRAESCYVFLLDAQIGTGATAFMAIRVLLDHGVQEDRIIFVTFLVARKGGVSTLRKAFPRVRIITGTVDDELQESWDQDYAEVAAVPGDGPSDETVGKKVWVIKPGMGQIGDRYYL